MTSAFFFCLVFSYLAKFLGSFDSQYEALFGGIDISNEMIGKKIFQQIKKVKFDDLDVKELSQKITRYLKSSQRTFALPVGEVMLNRTGGL